MINKSLHNLLRFIIVECLGPWDLILLTTVFTNNSFAHRIIKKSPFEVVYDMLSNNVDLF